MRAKSAVSKIDGRAASVIILTGSKNASANYIGFSNRQVASFCIATKIQFYSWDLDYKTNLGFRPSILLDKKGEQTVSLKAEQHIIAVKVVNDDGLEAIEIIRLTL
ncbi:MAG: hypothetical protein RLZZ628_4079 [Bacteroidota bacterium]|jgi:hypothetical protein